MGLRETISNLSPNEFLAKMQDMMNMYMESVDMSKIPHYGNAYSMVPEQIKKNQRFLLDNFHTTYKIKGTEQAINFLSPPANPDIKLTGENIVGITDAITNHLEMMSKIYEDNSKDNSKTLNDAFISNMNGQCVRFYNWGKENGANMHWLKNAIAKMKKAKIPLTKEVQKIFNSIT